MAYIHRAFLFNRDGFSQRIDPIINSLNSGTAKLLFYEAMNSSSQISPETWVLNSAGSSLFDIRNVNCVGLPYKEPIEPRLDNLSILSQCDVGYWFLLILSVYIKQCGGIGSNFDVLTWCLEKIGWELEDITLLMYGNPTCKLLHEKAGDQPIKLSNSDPYWYWVRLTHAIKSGWISQQQITHLFETLKSTKIAIDKFDHHLFGGRWGFMAISIPDGQLDYLDRAKKAYEAAIEMLGIAIANKMEIYEVICYT